MKLKLPPLVVQPAARKWLDDLLRRARSGVITTVVDITPERAAALLERNDDNRTVRAASLEKIVDDMRNNRFQFNGESVIVSGCGHLNDGQHRLWASVISGKPFTVNLVVGVKRDTRVTVDTGVIRTTADQLRVNYNTPHASVAAAAARYVCGWLDTGTFGLKMTVSCQAQIQQVQCDPLLQEAAAWADNSSKRLTGMLRPSLAAFAHYVFSTRDKPAARAFMDQLALGADLAATNPIFLCRDKLRMGVSHKGRLTDLQRLELTVRAWNHWCAGPHLPVSRLSVHDTMPPVATPRPLPSVQAPASQNPASPSQAYAVKSGVPRPAHP